MLPFIQYSYEAVFLCWLFVHILYTAGVLFNKPGFQFSFYVRCASGMSRACAAGNVKLKFTVWKVSNISNIMTFKRRQVREKPYIYGLHLPHGNLPFTGENGISKCIWIINIEHEQKMSNIKLRTTSSLLQVLGDWVIVSSLFQYREMISRGWVGL